MDERHFGTKVSHKLREAGLAVELQPRLNLFSRQRPDILAHHDGETIAIEVKTSSLGLADILQVGSISADRHFIVVPSGMKRKVASSVLDYAEQNRIKVLEIDELEDFISSLKATSN